MCRYPEDVCVWGVPSMVGLGWGWVLWLESDMAPDQAFDLLPVRRVWFSCDCSLGVCQYKARCGW